MLALASLILAAASAQAETSTAAAPPPRIELITMGAGGYLYSYWGHAALRVINPADGSDLAYNYGGVDWEEGTLMRMMRGYVRAYMFVNTFAEVLAAYSGEDRTITRMPIALEPEVARQLADRLKGLGNAQRHYYAYHHFYDNCTTRIAEELDRALGGKLRASGADRAAGTFRSRVLRPVREHVLLYVMLDLAYSPVVDRPITEWEAAFLTPGLEELVEEASIAKSRIDVFRSIGFDESALWTWPWTTVYLLFLTPLLALIFWKPRLGARIWGAIAGALGTLFIALWIGSTYDFFHGNWNLLVFPPLHFALVAGARFRREYLLGHLALLVVLLVLSQTGVISQAIGPALGLALPIAIALVVRSPYASAAQARG